MVKIVERLDYTSGVSDEGDVVPLADIDPDQTPPMLDERRIARMGPRVHSIVDIIDTIRESSDFTARNRLLLEMRGAIAKANHHAGAAARLAGGHYIKGYNDVGHAETLEGKARTKAQALGEQACTSCDLAAFCGIDSQHLIASLSADRRVRDRFGRRVVKPGNDGFCEENLADPPRKQPS